MKNKNNKTYSKALSLFIIFTAAFLFSSCIDGEIDVSRLMEKPLDYTIPHVKNVEERFWGDDPQVASDYTEYYIDINPVYGEKLRLSQVEILPQLIMEAYNNPDNIVDYEFKQKFNNKITVYNDSNQKELEIELASDGTIFARQDKDSPVFRFPEYVYYSIEATLWNMGDADVDITETCNSLIEPLIDWSPSKGPEMIELRLDHDIKTMLYLMYGYADAVFISYTRYSTLDLDQQYKIYMLLSYSGYEYLEDELDGSISFYPRYGEVVPVQLVYSWVEGGFWALTDMKFAEQSSYNKYTEVNIRKVLPFLDTQAALEDLDDTSTLEEEIKRQAMEYLSSIGKGYITVDDRK